MKIKKGDTVKIIKGKDAGQQGKVVMVLNDKGRVVVENLNVFKKHLKQSGIIDITKPIRAENVKFVCPSCNQPSKVGYRFSKENKKERYCKKCNSIV